MFIVLHIIFNTSVMMPTSLFLGFSFCCTRLSKIWHYWQSLNKLFSMADRQSSPMLVQCWSTVYDAGPTLRAGVSCDDQHLINWSSTAIGKESIVELESLHKLYSWLSPRDHVAGCLDEKEHVDITTRKSRNIHPCPGTYSIVQEHTPCLVPEHTSLYVRALDTRSSKWL